MGGLSVSWDTVFGQYLSALGSVSVAISSAVAWGSFSETWGSLPVPCLRSDTLKLSDFQYKIFVRPVGLGIHAQWASGKAKHDKPQFSDSRFFIFLTSRLVMTSGTSRTSRGEKSKKKRHVKILGFPVHIFFFCTTSPTI